MSDLEKKQIRRDELIIELWSVLNAIFLLDKLDETVDEDINLWSSVTAHSAIQKRLNQKEGKE